MRTSARRAFLVAVALAILCPALWATDADAQPGSTRLAAAEAARCSPDAIAGEYRTRFGRLACDATTDGLRCCYGAGCRNTVDLVLDEAGQTLSGTWRYPDGIHGPVRFPVSDRCRLESGRWNDAGRKTPDRGWEVIETVPRPPPASAEATPAPSRPHDTRRAGPSTAPFQGSTILADFRETAGWSHTGVEAAARVRRLDNGDFAEPHAAVVVTDAAGTVVAREMVHELGAFSRDLPGGGARCGCARSLSRQGWVRSPWSARS